MARRKMAPIKPAYTAVWHHANKNEYQLIEIKSVADLLNMVIKHKSKIIIYGLANYMHPYVAACGINPAEVDFIITVYDDYIE